MNYKSADINQQQSLPWWTWVLPLFIFFTGTQISLLSKVTTGSSLFYFPGPFALILVYWWGPRVLLAYYINSVLCAGFWDLDKVELWPIYGLPEVVFAFLSWLFFIKMMNGKCWLPNIRQTIYFLLLGILVPLVIYKFFQEIVFFFTGDISEEKFWHILVTTGLGDFISMFGISVPVLYFLTGKMSRMHLLYTREKIPDGIENFLQELRSILWKIEIAGLVILAGIINYLLNFEDYWFIYSVLSLYVAIRFGFGTVVVFNSYILLITYILPSVFDREFSESLILNNGMLKIQIGTGLLYVFSTITGRVMSDMREVEKRLSSQNQELEQTNKELDRFVYSVSHDLSAPLKSILGLVNIGRLNQHSQEQLSYLGKIELSTRKLEVFIKEVLDYSQNKRIDTVMEQIKLQDLCSEILDNLRYIEEFKNVKIDLNAISGVEVINDKMRLKIILNSILANAIQYQKRIPGHLPEVKISSFKTPTKMTIRIEDNGEGIHPDVKEKIFNMFFRGHLNSRGSGLGLYIAREAAMKIGGSIAVESEYGKGSIFSIEFDQIGN